MELYLSIVVFTLIFSLIAKNVEVPIVKKTCIFLIVIVCSLMPGLRDVSVGTDTLMYTNFLTIDRTYHDWLVSGLAIEPGFVSLIKIYQYFELSNYSYFLFGVALLFNFLIVSTIFKISPNPAISILVFLTFSTIYFFHFNVVRASMALAFFIYSIPYLLNKNYKKCYFWLFVSVFFHISALVFLFVPIAYAYLRRRPVLVFFASLIFMGLFSATSVILSFIGGLIGTTKYGSYNIESNIGGGFFVIYLALAVFSFLALSNKTLRSSDLYVFSLYLTFMAALTWFCIVFLGLRYEGPGRIVVYFYTGVIFLFPSFLQVFTPISRLFICFVLYAIFLSIYYYIFVVKGIYGVFPYSINPAI